MHFFGHKKPVSNCVMSRLSGNKIPSFILKQNIFSGLDPLDFLPIYTRGKKQNLTKSNKKKTTFILEFIQTVKFGIKKE